MSPVTAKPKAVAKGPDMSQFASNNPDEMERGGLMDDFDGLIKRVRYRPWDYGGTIDHHVLGVAVDIQPYDDHGKPEGEVFTQMYSAGDLDQFTPADENGNIIDLSVDQPEGEEPDPTFYDGIYAARVGKRNQMNDNTNWAQFVGSAKDSGFDPAAITPACTFLEGVFAHFNRMPQKKRSGIVTKMDEGGDNKKKKNQDILLITEIKPAPKAAAGKAPTAPPAKPAAKPAPGKPAAKAAPAPEPEPVEEEAAAEVERTPLDQALYELIVAKLAEGVELKKPMLANLAVKGLDATLRAKGVKRVVEQEFLDSAPDAWLYDAETGELISVTTE